MPAFGMHGTPVDSALGFACGRLGHLVDSISMYISADSGAIASNGGASGLLAFDGARGVAFLGELFFQGEALAGAPSDEHHLFRGFKLFGARSACHSAPAWAPLRCACS
mmetsp:Transcript_36482/g.116101  ORF Transcript_36482/g.116101 Transcript_36482/m.116101 type:complete len:109 (+) Transcript_36482:370-696(+)